MPGWVCGCVLTLLLLRRKWNGHQVLGRCISHCLLPFTLSAPGQLVELPTIIEAHKTLDKKFLFKVGDIHQMVVCTPKEADEDGSKAEEGGANKRLRSGRWPHGLTPPLKNVRRKRCD